MTVPELADFPSRTYDKIRYGDTDRQGHVNNAVFLSFLETGRVDLMAAAGRVFAAASHNAVVVHMAMDYRKELFWPGTVEIGTAVMQVGRTSMRFQQALFQNGACAATAECVIVQVDAATGRPVAIEEEQKAGLEQLKMLG
jgi:acyl-CoA thioester hydrolase